MNKQEVLMRGKVFFKLGQINGNLRMKNISAAQKNLKVLETMLGNCNLIPLESDHIGGGSGGSNGMSNGGGGN